MMERFIKLFVIAVYAYIGVTAFYMHFMGHDSIVPVHENKEYNYIDGVPPITQESVDIAVLNFEIIIPANALYPTLDLDMPKPYQGTARFFHLTHTCVPEVGPAAFGSWGVLGAVLAHEVEVHCNQNSWKNMTDRIFGTNSTPMLEREAYTYTLLDHQRFHLTPFEQTDIALTMLLLYPLGDDNEQDTERKATEKRTHSTTESPQRNKDAQAPAK